MIGLTLMRFHFSLALGIAPDARCAQKPETGPLSGRSDQSERMNQPLMSNEIRKDNL
jgi:hypothetical protein